MLVNAASLIEAMNATLPHRLVPDKRFPFAFEGLIALTTDTDVVLVATDRYTIAMATTGDMQPGRPWTAAGIPDEWARYGYDGPIPGAFYAMHGTIASILGDIRVLAGGTRRSVARDAYVHVTANPDALIIESQDKSQSLLYPTHSKQFHGGVRSVLTVAKVVFDAEPGEPPASGSRYNGAYISRFAALGGTDNRTPVRVYYVPTGSYGQHHIMCAAADDEPRWAAVMPLKS